MSGQLRNFRLLATRLDIQPVLEELRDQPWLWEQIQVRQLYEGSVHVDTQTIVLRGPTTLEGLFDNLNNYDFDVLIDLPATASLLREIAQIIKAREVGRLMIVRLKADGWIRPHVDEGAYARYFARFHLVLESNPCCRFNCGEEHVHMAAGELWWFNHQLEHSVLNQGPDRIHLIADFTAPGFTGAFIDGRMG